MPPRLHQNLTKNLDGDFMLKDATYKEKCILLKPWMPQILETVKKDLKNEHLKNDFKFVKKYFSGKNLNKLTTQNFVDAYSTALEQEEKAEEIAEFLTNRWLMKNTELYEYFEAALSKISPDFTQLTEIKSDQAEEIIEKSNRQFGPLPTYLFSVMNSVVFPKECYEKLEKQAHAAQKIAHQEEIESQTKSTHESLKQQYELQIARLTDKYEKKLSGMERKYFQDTESLRKQLATLQKRLNGQ